MRRLFCLHLYVDLFQRKRSPKRVPIIQSEQSLQNSTSVSSRKYKTYSHLSEHKPSKRTKHPGGVQKPKPMPLHHHELHSSDADSECNTETYTYTKAELSRPTTPLVFKDIPADYEILETITKDSRLKTQTKKRKGRESSISNPNTGVKDNLRWAKVDSSSKESPSREADENSDSDSFSLYIRVHSKDPEQQKSSLKREISQAVSEAVKSKRKSANTRCHNEESLMTSTQNGMRRKASVKYVSGILSSLR